MSTQIIPSLRIISKKMMNKVGNCTGAISVKNYPSAITSDKFRAF